MMIEARHLFLILLVVLHANSQGTREYCQWQKFEAKCAGDEVVVMTSAAYGRMRLGTCVKQDFGYLGCKQNVKPHLDSLCSGRQHCSFSVPDDTMKALKPCSELESYLEASYSCHPVVTGTKQECERAGKLVVRQQAGSLSSWQAQQYELGTRQCPWLLEVGPGQRINITLEDYAVGDRSSLSSPVICPRYANIREQSRSTSICGGERRTKAIYLSDTNLVYVEMVPDLTKSTASFLLNFKAVGCVDPEVPAGAQVQRGENTATITCPDGSIWHITCHENTWRGNFDNCGLGNATWTVWEVLSNDWSSPQGILIVSCLGVALGVLIGVLLLILALFCIRRKRPDPNANKGLRLSTEAAGNIGVFNDNSNVPLVDANRTKEEIYRYRWTPRQMVPLPAEPIICHDYRKDSETTGKYTPPPYCGSLRDDHIYESPN